MKARGFLSTFFAFAIGLPAGLCLAYAIHNDLVTLDPQIKHYFNHEIELATLVMFCCGLGALLGKFLACLNERSAIWRRLISPWDGQPHPVASARTLHEQLERQPGRVRNTYLGRRVAAILDFVESRGTANELDDQIRALSDNDAMAMEGSYALVRLITWAMPIFGFLGTVLGITAAIQNVSPQALENEGITGVTQARMDSLRRHRPRSERSRRHDVPDLCPRTARGRHARPGGSLRRCSAHASFREDRGQERTVRRSSAAKYQCASQGDGTTRGKSGEHLGEEPGKGRFAVERDRPAATGTNRGVAVRCARSNHDEPHDHADRNGQKDAGAWPGNLRRDHGAFAGDVRRPQRPGRDAAGDGPATSGDLGRTFREDCRADPSLDQAAGRRSSTAALAGSHPAESVDPGRQRRSGLISSVCITRFLLISRSG